jgi:hypothetical protein
MFFGQISQLIVPSYQGRFLSVQGRVREVMSLQYNGLFLLLIRLFITLTNTSEEQFEGRDIYFGL